MDLETLEARRQREAAARRLYRGEWKETKAEKLSWVVAQLVASTIEYLDAPHVTFHERSYITETGNERYRIEVIRCANDLWTLDISKDVSDQITPHIGAGFQTQDFEIILYWNDPDTLSTVVADAATLTEATGLVKALWEAAEVGVIGAMQKLSEYTQMEVVIND